MQQCARCKRTMGFLLPVAINERAGLCIQCEGEVRNALHRFRNAFLSILARENVLTDEAWAWLVNGAMSDRLNLHEALAFIRQDSINFILALMEAEENADSIDVGEEEIIVEWCYKLALPNDFVQSIFNRLNRLRTIARIRDGYLPNVQTTAALLPNEICHLDLTVSYFKGYPVQNNTITPGRLIVTNKRLLFLSPTEEIKVPLSSILRVETGERLIWLELQGDDGSGYYRVSDTEYVDALINTAIHSRK